MLSSFRFPLKTALPTRRDRLGLRGVFDTDDHGADDATLLLNATTGSVGVGENAWGLVAAIARLESTLASRDVDEPVTVWCAGAGGVAEPLTAALLIEALGLHADVLATDLCPLAAADRGPLPAWRTAWLPRALRGALTPGPEGFVVGDGVRSRLRGVAGDLRDGAPAGQFDLVVCRDVLHHYRPAVARQMLAHLRQATAPHGVLLLSAVDGLAAGLPLGTDPVVLVDGGGELRDPVAASTSPLLLLMGLLQDDVDDGHRSERFAALADGTDLAEARVAAAVAALADGDVLRARAQLALLPADDADHAVVTGLIELQAGRLGEARVALERATTSWLAPWLVASILVRQHRDVEARPWCRLALERLETCGESTTPIMAFLPEYAPERARGACQALLQVAQGGWHRP